ncbi:AraC family transcriptional regulator [Paludibacter sp.]|uniref:AraC family transcriptional regulator n=1 Tax=Paludibacter sp. TaxID=1898105 RepID=UPI001353AB5E|nr:AraC family transcriptional regulator [Paludibacter sp.]MTK52423.1 AraC family transcriptional regulator [Paludibacter sp.]
MQNKLTTREEYLRRINIVTEYINNHLDEKLDLSKLADLSNLSQFHFHRITKAFLGEPIGAYITRMRVETAARLLRYTDIPVQDVAFKVGYEMPSSLSKIFNQYYGISPIEFRNDKNFIIMKPALINPALNLKAPKILDLEDQSLIYIRHTGDYSSLDFAGAWTKLWGYVKSQKLFTAGIQHVCIYHDDPKVTEPDKLRTDICLVIHKQAKAEGEIGVKILQGGKFAVFHYQGAYANLGSVYDTIFGYWLPESGMQLRDVACYEKYLNHPDPEAPEKSKTEIYIPVQ